MSRGARLRDAAECAAGYLGIYALAGLVLIPIVSTIAGPSGIGQLTGIYLIVHFVSAVALWPSAAVVAMLLERLIGPAPWRRLWIAGIAAVPVIWVGTLLCGNLSDRLLEGMSLVWGWWGGILVYLSWAILFSNLTLLVTWVLPPRAGTPATPEGGRG